MILSYKSRIDPSRAQVAALDGMLASFCNLYNAALQQRIEAWQRCRKSLRYADQSAELKAVRAAYERLAGFSFSAEQQVLRRLDKSFRAFFARGKGFPRFRAASRYDSADFRVGDGLTLRKSGLLGIVGIPGEIKVRWHRELPSQPASAILCRSLGKWHVIFHVEVPLADARGGEAVGIDLGLSSLVALSTGEMIERQRITARHAAKLRRAQRALARCRRGSKRRGKAKHAVARIQAAAKRQRRDVAHKNSRSMVDRFAVIAIEDLNIKGLARGMLAKSVHDATWGQLVSMIRYKAACAGSRVIEVDPRGTSQTCPECGTVAPKTLAMRVHSCGCGCVLDRDVAAAKEILRRAGYGPGTGLQAPSQRVAA